MVILLHPRDNVVVAAANLAAGSIVDVAGESLCLAQAVPLGHKVARVAIGAGERVLRYGVPIGTMRAAVKPGDHVHSHNLDSDYIPPTRREGPDPTKGSQ